MPFFVDGNPTPGEISEALNYLLGNSQQTTSTDLGTGQITDATGNVVSYLYKYLHIKYADSFDGTVNFTNTPTNRTYYGLRNTDDTVESTNPSDYIWTKATPPAFGTTYLFYYSVTGGRRIDTLVSMSAPSSLYQPDTGAPIDLDMISGSTGSDGNSARICYAKSTSTSLSSTPATYQTSGSSSFPPTNTWGGGETWQATPPSLAVNEALFQSNGIYNPTTDLTTWNSPYLSNLKVASLSAISADLGTITAGTMSAVTVNSSTINTGTINGGTLSIGSSPAISGTSMTGTGSRIYSDGRMVVGNSTNNMVFDGTTLTINGNIVTYGNLNGTAVGQIIAGSFNFVPFTSSGTWTCPANVYKAKVTVIGGGAGGTNYNSGTPGGGGGSGGGAIKVITVVPGTVYTVTVGNGGGAGSNGSASSFSGSGITTITANGGTTASGTWIGGAGGTASGGDLNITGSGGGNGDGTGMNSYAGGYGGGAPFIGANAKAGTSGSANSGSGGGGGIASATTGGSGGKGLVIIEY